MRSWSRWMPGGPGSRHHQLFADRGSGGAPCPTAKEAEQPRGPSHAGDRPHTRNCYLPVRSRCLHPGQQQGRRWPSSSSSRVRRMRRSRVTSCLASSTQQMNSLRASGVMSFQASSAVGWAISALRRSPGSSCTTPPGTRGMLTGPPYSGSCPFGATGRAGGVRSCRVRRSEWDVVVSLSAPALWDMLSQEGRQPAGSSGDTRQRPRRRPPLLGRSAQGTPCSDAVTRFGRPRVQ
jgi:hypothetical protein